MKRYKDLKTEQLAGALEEQLKGQLAQKEAQAAGTPSAEAAATGLSDKELFAFAGFDASEAERGGYSNYSYWRATLRVFFKNRIAVFFLIVMVLTLLFTFIQPLLPGQRDPLTIHYNESGRTLSNLAPGEQGFTVLEDQLAARSGRYHAAGQQVVGRDFQLRGEVEKLLLKLLPQHVAVEDADEFAPRRAADAVGIPRQEQLHRSGRKNRAPPVQRLLQLPLQNDEEFAELVIVRPKSLSSMVFRRMVQIFLPLKIGIGFQMQHQKSSVSISM